jgi:hypothetical protein
LLVAGALVVAWLIVAGHRQPDFEAIAADRQSVIATAVGFFTFVATVGLASMALLQTVKYLVPVRGWFHDRHLNDWLERRRHEWPTIPSGLVPTRLVAAGAGRGEIGASARRIANFSSD